MLGFFILDQFDAILNLIDSRVRISQDNRGMGGNDRSSIFPEPFSPTKKVTLGWMGKVVRFLTTGNAKGYSLKEGT